MTSSHECGSRSYDGENCRRAGLSTTSKEKEGPYGLLRLVEVVGEEFLTGGVSVEFRPAPDQIDQSKFSNHGPAPPSPPRLALTRRE